MCDFITPPPSFIYLLCVCVWNSCDSGKKEGNANAMVEKIVVVGRVRYGTVRYRRDDTTTFVVIRRV